MSQRVPPRALKIALLVQTSSDWSRQVLRGVAAYALERGGWDFFIEARGFDEEISLPKDWQGHGAIVRLTNDKLARDLIERRLPAVNVSWLGRHHPLIPKLVADEAKCGRMAADHFLRRAFRHLAFVGPRPERAYQASVGLALEESCLAAGASFSIFRHPNSDQDLNQHLGSWLETLAKPVGVTVWNSDLGRRLIYASVSKWKIPREISVLSVEHDPLMSRLAPIPISSLDQDPHGVGHSAARLLESMILERRTVPEAILVPPLGVTSRLSSDTLAVDDEVLAGALSFIRERATTPIQVSDLESELHVSRRVLEHRFAKFLGHSPAAEIRRVRLERVKRLLLETNLSHSEISLRSGFQHPEVMARCFRREIGMTPGRYRKSRGILH